MFGVFYTLKVSLTTISENIFYIGTKSLFVYLQYTTVWVSVCVVVFPLPLARSVSRMLIAWHYFFLPEEFHQQS